MDKKEIALYVTSKSSTHVLPWSDFWILALQSTALRVSWWGMNKPLPAPNVPGNTEAERFDYAVRKILTVSKTELLKEEAKWKKVRARKKRAKESRLTVAVFPVTVVPIMSLIPSICQLYSYPGLGAGLPFPAQETFSPDWQQRRGSCEWSSTGLKPP